MKLTIIILNFNTKTFLQQALESIMLSTDTLQKEIIVVDNASTDESVGMVKKNFPQVKTLALQENKGFATGNNAGIKQAQGQLILLLNSDTKILPDTLQTMVNYMDNHPDVGITTCKVELENGHIDPASHRGFPTPWASFTYFSGLEKIFPRSHIFGQYHQGWLDMNQAHEIDTPVGAFYLIRRKVIDQIGLLDERFFMYAEDIDWSLRAKQAGWKIMYVPTTKIIHYKKKSGRAASSKTLRREISAHFFDTMRLFYDKHYRTRYPWIVRQLIIFGIWIVSKIKK